MVLFGFDFWKAIFHQSPFEMDISAAEEHSFLSSFQQYPDLIQVSSPSSHLTWASGKSELTAHSRGSSVTSKHIPSLEQGMYAGDAM